MRPRSPSLLAFSLAAALALSACGGGGGDRTGLLPGKTADEIVANLNSVEASFEAGSCVQATQKADDVVSQVGSLPTSVEPQLRQVLHRGALRLQERVASDCQPETTAPTAPLTTESTTEPTTSESTTTSTKEQTQSTTTQETTTQPTTQSTPTTTVTPPPPPPPTTGGGSGGIGPGGVAGGQ